MQNNKQQLIKNFESQYDLKEINKDWFKPLSEEESEARGNISLAGKTTKVWKDVLKAFFKNKWNVIFLSIFILIVIMAIVIPMTSIFTVDGKVGASRLDNIKLLKPYWVPGYDQIDYVGPITAIGTTIDPSDIISQTQIGTSDQWHIIYHNKYAAQTIMGTDSAGRDVWTRLWASTAWSLALAFLVAIIETIIGVSVGIYVGFNAGKRQDTIIMRIIEIFGSIPSLIWMMVFAMVIGTGFWSIAFVLILVGWVGPVYSARMFTIKVKDAEFIKAAEAIGVSSAGRLFRHILPNISGRLLVSFVHRIPAVIFFEASLIFLGLHVGGDSAISLGNMINDGRIFDTMMTQPFYVGSVSVVILLITISLQIVANGMRDALDPKIVGGK